MPVKTEETALLSAIVLSAACVFARRAELVESTRGRVFLGAVALSLWQRFLASGMTTWSARSDFYVPARKPEDEWPHGTNYPGQGYMYNKTALVTGCTPGGIGFHTAINMFRMGARVIVTMRDSEGISDITGGNATRAEAAAATAMTSGAGNLGAASTGGSATVPTTTEPAAAGASGALSTSSSSSSTSSSAATSGDKAFGGGFRSFALPKASSRPDGASAYPDDDLVQQLVQQSRVREDLVSMFAVFSRINVVRFDCDGDIDDAVSGVVRQLDALGVKKIDVLVNNIGAMYPLQSADTPQRHAAMGLERHVAVNTVAPILLTEALKPRIVKGGRVVYVAADAHRSIKDVDSLTALLQGRAVARSHAPFYAASKLAVICYAAEQQAADPQHVHVAVHPGMALTNLQRGLGSWKFFEQLGVTKYIEGVTSLVLRSPKEAAHGPSYCAADVTLPKELRESKGFYVVDGKPGARHLSRLAADEAARAECMRVVRDLISGARERKRKQALRQASGGSQATATAAATGGAVAHA
jgi:short-subunit dehydrogenase